MKKVIFVLLLVLTGVLSQLKAQKYAYIDTDYILSNIPAFQSAQEQLEQISQQYQKELEMIHTELDQMFKDFQAEAVLLSNEMKQRREDVIVSKEREYKKLQRQYFAPEGDLFQKRQALIKPIQDDLFNAVKDIAEQGGYAVIFDKAGSVSMLYTNPRYDLSDQVLRKLGYKN